jgi:hypothetical protein
VEGRISLLRVENQNRTEGLNSFRSSLWNCGFDIHSSPSNHRPASSSSSPSNNEQGAQYSSNSPEQPLNLTPSSFQHFEPQQPFASQNLHPAIAQDLRNIEMNLGGVEFHFFDSPTDVGAEVQQSFGAQETSTHSPLPNGHGMYTSTGAEIGMGNRDNMATESGGLPHSNPHPGMTGMPNMHFGDMPMGVTGMSDMSDMGEMFGNNSMFSSSPPSTGAFSALGHPQTNSQLPLPFAAPILDATWQSFVEQLGF